MDKGYKIIFAICLTLVTFGAQAQMKVGDNPQTINPSAVLDLESNNRGLLLPRVALTATAAAAPLVAHVAGMTVYNTVTAGSGATAVAPGYYYNDGDQWVRIASNTDIPVEPWRVVNSTSQATANTEDIYQAGRVAIGTAITSGGIPSFTAGAATVNPTLYVAGDISTIGKVWTTSSVYADYVFEQYFDGKSDIKKDYQFTSLEYIKEFVEKNKHLPGVTRIDELLKDENGYLFDMTQLSIQQLEKIEELFLHLIEQQDQISKQYAEIEHMKLRLERLEKLLLDSK